ncbi:MAG: magnesium transporter [Ruminococcaceae bacterium]|nr:magnesium transporter [Oscillospiraceae bacterium]
METTAQEITIDTILEILDCKDYSTLKNLLSEMNPVDIAELLKESPRERILLIFRLLPTELAADVFVELDSDFQEELIIDFSDSELSFILSEMYVDDTVDLIEEMPPSLVSRILSKTDSETRETINQILKYPKDSAGSIMNTDYVRLYENMTVAQAFEKIRRVGLDKETIYTCYVTTLKKKLIGVVSVRRLLLADEDTPITDIMETNIIFSYTTENREDAAGKIKDYGLIAIPIVDNDERIVGIVTVDDALDVIEEETEEDFSKMAAITPNDESYLKTSVFKLWRARIPWLLILMFSSTFTSSIISSYESVIAASGLVVLTAFMPMIMGTAGNAGGQSSVTVIRALSLEDITFRDFFRVFWKEARVAVLCSVPLSIACFAKIIFIDLEPHEWRIALVVCLTMVITVFIAKMVGFALPLLAKKIKLDPAVMASPFITTIVDSISLIVYFGIASAVLGL